MKIVLWVVLVLVLIGIGGFLTVGAAFGALPALLIGGLIALIPGVEKAESFGWTWLALTSAMAIAGPWLVLVSGWRPKWVDRI